MNYSTKKLKTKYIEYIIKYNNNNNFGSMDVKKWFKKPTTRAVRIYNNPDQIKKLDDLIILHNIRHLKINEDKISKIYGIEDVSCTCNNYYDFKCI